MADINNASTADLAQMAQQNMAELNQKSAASGNNAKPADEFYSSMMLSAIAIPDLVGAAVGAFSAVSKPTNTAEIQKRKQNALFFDKTAKKNQRELLSKAKTTSMFLTSPTKGLKLSAGYRMDLDPKFRELGAIKREQENLYGSNDQRLIDDLKKGSAKAKNFLNNNY